MAKPRALNIKNKKVEFDYHVVDRLEAGVQLSGTEVKSIKNGHASLKESFCTIMNNELWIRNMHISEYEQGTYNNHVTRRDRKLLLHKRELKKWQRKVTEKGMSIVPYSLYLSDRGFIKIEIILGQGKKSFDKRASIKEKDNKRELDRIKKMHN